MNDGDWKHSSSSGLVFVLDAAADYPFVNQTTFIEYYLINLSYLTSDNVGRKNRSLRDRTLDTYLQKEFKYRTRSINSTAEQKKEADKRLNTGLNSYLESTIQ